MSDAETELEDGKTADLRVIRSAEPAGPNLYKARIQIIPLLITFTTTGLAAMLGWAMWNAYMGTPWTRDGTVRTYVVTMAPEVAGRIVELPIVDNQFVHRGDLLIVIDPTNYKIALQQAEATVQQTQATAQNAQREAERRNKLNDLAVTVEQRETYDANAVEIGRASCRE